MSRAFYIVAVDILVSVCGTRFEVRKIRFSSPNSHSLALVVVGDPTMSSEDIGATGASGPGTPRASASEIPELPTVGTPGTARNGSEAPVGGASEKDPIKRKMLFFRAPIKKKESTSGTTPERPLPEWNEE